MIQKHPHHRHHPNSPLLKGYAFPELNLASPVTTTAHNTQSLAVPSALELPPPVTSAPSPPSKQRDPYIPPLNSYGSFHTEPHIHSSIASEAHRGHREPQPSGTAASSTRHTSRSSSTNSSEHEPLLPSRETGYPSLRERIRGDLVPFSGTFKTLFGWMTFRWREENPEVCGSFVTSSPGL